MATARCLMACAVLLLVTAQPQMAQVAAPDARAIHEDINALVRYVSENYAYLDRKAIAWPSIPQLYAADVKSVTTGEAVVGVADFDKALAASSAVRCPIKNTCCRRRHMLPVQWFTSTATGR